MFLYHLAETTLHVIKKKMKNEMLKRAEKNAYKLENIQNKEIQQITFEPMQSVFIFTWIQV